VSRYIPLVMGLMGDEPGKMSEEARRKAGITKTLPRSVHEALVKLDIDSKLVKELGKDFVQKYISVKEVSMSFGGI
jgi:glutamine synthetase